MDTILGLVIIAGIIAFVVIRKKANAEEQRKYENGEMADEEKKRYETKLANKEAKRKAETIKKVQIMGSASNSKKKAGSSIVRGAVGGALLGPAGLVGGALSGKNKTTETTTFLILYEDGHKETKTVKNGSMDFNYLIDFVDME